MIVNSSDSLSSLLHDARKNQVDSLAEYFQTVTQDDILTALPSISDLLPPAKDPRGRVQNYGPEEQPWPHVIWDLVSSTQGVKLKTSWYTAQGPTDRGRGYISGTEKTDNNLQVHIRETTPTTIYNKQTLNKQTVVDIVNTSTLRDLLKVGIKELVMAVSSAILTEDRREDAAYRIPNPSGDATSGIRSVAEDSDEFTIKGRFDFTESLGVQPALKIIKKVLELKQEYQGSGSLIAFISPIVLSELLTIQVSDDAFLFDGRKDLAHRLGVTQIVPVGLLDASMDAGPEDPRPVPALIIFDPEDYSLGTDTNSFIGQFTKFDIDYNRLKYLLETRLSGALTVPKSAISLCVTIDNRIVVDALPPEPDETNSQLLTFQEPYPPNIIHFWDQNKEFAVTHDTPQRWMDLPSPTVVLTPVLPDEFKEKYRLSDNLVGKTFTYTNPYTDVDMEAPTQDDTTSLVTFVERTTPTNVVEWVDIDTGDVVAGQPGTFDIFDNKATVTVRARVKSGFEDRYRIPREFRDKTYSFTDKRTRLVVTPPTLPSTRRWNVEKQSDTTYVDERVVWDSSEFSGRHGGWTYTFKPITNPKLLNVRPRLAPGYSPNDYKLVLNGETYPKDFYDRRTKLPILPPRIESNTRKQVTFPSMGAMSNTRVEWHSDRFVGKSSPFAFNFQDNQVRALNLVEPRLKSQYSRNDYRMDFQGETYPKDFRDHRTRLEVKKPYIPSQERWHLKIPVQDSRIHWDSNRFTDWASNSTYNFEHHQKRSVTGVTPHLRNGASENDYYLDFGGVTYPRDYTDSRTSLPVNPPVFSTSSRWKVTFPPHSSLYTRDRLKWSSDVFTRKRSDFIYDFDETQTEELRNVKPVLDSSYSKNDFYIDKQGHTYPKQFVSGRGKITVTPPKLNEYKTGVTVVEPSAHTRNCIRWESDSFSDWAADWTWEFQHYQKRVLRDVRPVLRSDLSRNEHFVFYNGESYPKTFWDNRTRIVVYPPTMASDKQWMVQSSSAATDLSKEHVRWMNNRTTPLQEPWTWNFDYDSEGYMLNAVTPILKSREDQKKYYLDFAGETYPKNFTDPRTVVTGATMPSFYYRRGNNTLYLQGGGNPQPKNYIECVVTNPGDYVGDLPINWSLHNPGPSRRLYFRVWASKRNNYKLPNWMRGKTFDPDQRNDDYPDEPGESSPPPPPKEGQDETYEIPTDPTGGD